MGVRGLTSFLKDNRTSLCRTVILEPISTDSPPSSLSIPVIVDAWGVIFRLYLDSLPWTSGGEYLAFYKLVRKLITSWRSVGLEPIFIFDGASPPEKHARLIERLQSNISIAQLFFTTSTTSRSSPSFSRTSAILPPFAQHAFIAALASLNAKARHVPLGEADGECVMIADQLGAFIFGQDSDFVILMSGSTNERVRGYCPLDNLMWIEGQVEEGRGEDSWTQQSSYISSGLRSAGDGQQHQFTTVVSKRFQHKQSSLLPPKGFRYPRLVVAYYPPGALSLRLHLPNTLMPLFSSLVGNDYTPASALEIFFEPGLNHNQRIDKVARILREQAKIFVPSTNKSNDAGDRAVQLVTQVMKKLSVREFINEQQRANLVDAIIDATFQYTLPLSGTCCAVYPFCGETTSTGCKTPFGPVPESVMAFVRAQKKGLVSSITSCFLNPDRVYIWSMLEDPSGPCHKASELSREVRRAAYEYAAQGLQDFLWPEEEDGLTDAGDGQRQSRGEEGELLEMNNEKALCELLGVQEVPQSSLVDTENEIFKPISRKVIEYVRQGSSTRISARSIDLCPLTPNLSPCLLPLSTRLEMYLSTLQSSTPSIQSLNPKFHPLIAIIRFCILKASRRTSTRNGNGTGNVNVGGKWRQTEVEAVLRAGIGSLAAWERDIVKPGGSGLPDNMDWPTLSSRNADIVAQLTAAMTDAHLLAQSLLLIDDNESNGNPNYNNGMPHTSHPNDNDFEPRPTLNHIRPWVFFSGLTIHSLLSGLQAPGSIWRWTAAEDTTLSDCLSAIFEGLDVPLVIITSPIPKSRVAVNGICGGQREKRDKVKERSEKGEETWSLEQLSLYQSVKINDQQQLAPRTQQQQNNQESQIKSQSQRHQHRSKSKSSTGVKKSSFGRGQFELLNEL